LLVLHGISAFAVPATVPGFADAPRDWLERLFPGVPGWWVGLRLVLLATGACLIARALPDASALPEPVSSAPVRSPRVALPREWIAVALAMLALALSISRSQLSRAGEALFLASLLLPALALCTRRGASAGADTSAAGLRASWILVAGWVVWQLAIARRSLLSASYVDTWLGHQYAQEAIATPRSLLLEGALPGLSGVYLFLQGIPALGDRIPLSFEILHCIAVAWLAATAIGVDRLARTWLGGATAAPVAVGLFLFAPFTLMMPLSPTPYFLGPGFGVAVLILADAAARGSASAFVAFAALAALTPTIPLAAPAVGVAGLRVAAALLRGVRPSVRVWLAAAAVATAAAWVAMPTPGTLERMVGAYAATYGEWEGLESALLGQTSAFDVVRAWQEPLRGSYDIVAAGLLAPFAVARTPMRGWADSLFDPIGAVLLAIGLAMALRSSLRSGRSRWLIAFFAATLLPGLVSSFDRPSITRMGTLLLSAALLASLGAQALLAGVAPRRRVAAVGALVAGIAVGGATLFFVVNPGVLRASSLAIAIEAVTERPDGSTVVLDYPSQLDVGWLHTARIAEQLGRPPIAAMPIDALARITARVDADPGGTHVLLWSPALEADRGVARMLCQRWPSAGLFLLEDRTGLSHAWAARIGPGNWTPTLPASRWAARSCAEALTTS
jgi:hypothetical protein